MFLSIGNTSCYKPIAKIPDGQYYLEGDWSTSEINFYDNGTFHKISTVYDVGGFSSIYGTYLNENSTIRFKDSMREFHERHMVILKHEEQLDSLVLTFKEFIPLGFSEESNTTYLVSIKGELKNGSKHLIAEKSMNLYPARLSDYTFKISQKELNNFEQIWVERFNIKTSFSLSKDEFKNATHIKYPVFYRWEYESNKKPYKPYQIKYWTAKTKKDKYIFEEFTEGFKPRKMKYKIIESSK